MSRTTSGYDWIWLPTRLAICARDGWRCIACRKRGQHRGGLSLDHVVPGRGNSHKNLVTLCKSCNSSKGCRTFRQWRPELGAAVRDALRRPLDRAAGRAMADELKPGWRERKRAADRRRSAALRAGTYDPTSFNTAALEAA